MNFNIEPVVEIDPFTKEKSIKWDPFHWDPPSSGFIDFRTFSSIVGGVSFQVSVNYLNRKDLIVFRFQPKSLPIQKGDKILFLFENGEVVTFHLTSECYVYEFLSKGLEVMEVLTQNEIDLFSDQVVSSWKIELLEKGIDIVGNTGAQNRDRKQYDGGQALKYLFDIYKKAVQKEIPNYTPLKELSGEAIPVQSNGDSCYVYLMVDTVNQFYKIGISNDPNYRERTLQSEKPTIELLASKSFVSRKIAEAIEKALHDAYKNKRIRGEWFELTEIDVKEIRLTLES